jgi:hypothetical protein
MADVCVYQFTQRKGDADENTASGRWATLETINGKGEAILESRIVVNHTEIDGDGFLVRFGNASREIDDLWAQIRSLKLRAQSRDWEALHLIESAATDRKRILGLESQELRDQAQRLTKYRTDLISEKLGRATDLDAFTQFGRIPTTE